MHIIKKTYQIMSGEPAIGSVTEYDLVADKYEVEDWIIEKVKEDGFAQDEYEFDEAIIDAHDYIDVEMVNDYLESVDTDKLSELKLYVAADVEAPVYRKKAT